MSTLADIQTQFLNLLNRDDCSTDLALTFITQAIQRIQRGVRLPSMERLVVYSVTGSPMSMIPVPNDLIQVKDIYVTLPAGVDTASGVVNPSYQITQAPGLVAQGPLIALRNMPYRELLSLSPSSLPYAYARFQTTFQIAGPALVGSTIELSYYGSFSDFADVNSSNEITASSPDLVTYCALSLAGDYFASPRTDSWEARYQQYLQETVSMGEDVDRHGGPQLLSNPHAEYI